ncbi:hypothetical protein E5676_scaffold469G00060 [Cucumis melo var. makuwa]|uniref:Uncharacterized protein n=1 Tax=Cucumis melo var. makuwa TaxID=1194695 RepID=A0A5D3BCR8_CUCMM|nr:hypothetical protein E5676_scaffold469G00060 [Cucumis melo var. makuwa]
MLDARYSVVMLMGYVVDWNCMSMDLEVTIRSTRLICASFWSTRLMCTSFGSTRLICALYGTTRLLCGVRAQRGADRREAGRTREGHMDAPGFLIASAMWFALAQGLAVSAHRPLPNKQEIYNTYHTELQTMPYQWWPDSFYYRQTPSNVNGSPNSLKTLAHKLVACLPKSSSTSLFDHQFEDERLY